MQVQPHAAAGGQQIPQLFWCNALLIASNGTDSRADQEAKLEKVLGRQYHLITRDDRLETVAQDIVRHFLGRGMLANAVGKAMVVSIDKATALRMLPDDQRVMNRSVGDVGGEILAVSQFTLYASTRKGNRPSWGRAARGEVSGPLFDQFVARLSTALGRPVPAGPKVA